MATNPYVNKVQYVEGGIPRVLIDLTADTVTADKLISGYTAHDASGAPITGTASEGAEQPVWQDEDGWVYVSDTVAAPVGIYASDGWPILDMEPPQLNLQTKTKSYTPTETAQSETVTADSGYDALGQVNVSVGAISSSYVGSAITRRSSTDLTASGGTVTVPSGYYSAQATKNVASGTEGTPTATKSSPSNHAVSVTPSVTNSAGYISGGTKTGTAVSVSASELVSGTLSVTQNGTVDVTNYASANVNVPSDDFIVTLTYNDSTDMWEPDCTYAELYAAYDAGKEIAFEASSNPCVWYYVPSQSCFSYSVLEYYNDWSGNYGYAEKAYFFKSTGITLVAYPSYADISAGDAEPSDVAEGKVFFNANGYQEGTASGGGGSTTHTATIITQGKYDNNQAMYSLVTFNGVRYYNLGSSFEFEAGQTLSVSLQSYSMGTRAVMENGEIIATGTGTYYSYSYTLPDHDIEIALQANPGATYAFANISWINSNYKFIASTTYTVSTTSTTEIDVGTFYTGDTSIWTSDKMVFVKIRSSSGRRNGYYYGSDAVFCNNVPRNNLSSTSSYLLYGTSFYQDSNGYLINYNLQRTSSTASVAGYGVYPTIIHDDGSIDIKARYSSSNTLTIVGIFSVEVYLLDWPGGVSPFNG